MIDLNNTDTRAIKALVRLKEPGHEAVLELIQSEISDAKRKLVQAVDMVHIHRLQGRAEAFEDLLAAVREAPAVVDARERNYRAQQRNPSTP